VERESRSAFGARGEIRASRIKFELSGEFPPGFLIQIRALSAISSPAARNS